jgi:hypothetical protein
MAALLYCRDGVVALWKKQSSFFESQSDHASILY